MIKHLNDQTYDSLKTLTRQLLLAIGEDPDRGGLKDTPDRVARWWLEFINYDSGNIETTFESVTTDQMVIIKEIPFYSLCEHHLLPFDGMISIGYITRERVLGLSKFARIVQTYAHSLQLQEKLVSQIADAVESLSGSPDVAVLGIGEHLCMKMRGVKSPGLMVTSVMRGAFREEASTRLEFLSIIKQGGLHLP